MVRSVRFLRWGGLLMVLAALSQANAAVTIDFNASSGYSDGNLVGQTDTSVGATWTAGAISPGSSLTVIDTGTNGKLSGTTANTNNSEVSLVLPTAVGPGSDGKIQISFTLTSMMAGVEDEGNTFRLAFKDADGGLLTTMFISQAGIQAREVSGNPYRTFGGDAGPWPLGEDRTFFVILDGSSASFYKDSVDPANQLRLDFINGAGQSPPVAGGIPYTSASNVVKEVVIRTNSFDRQAALLDNIHIAPEPSSLLAVLAAGFPLLWHRRRAA